MNLSIPLESFPMNREPSFSFRECKHVVRLRGLPFEVTTADIEAFFAHLQVVHVRLVDNGYGDALVAFGSEEDARLAMTLSGQYIGRRYVIVCWASAADIEASESDAISQRCPRITQELLNKVEDKCLNSEKGFEDLAVLVREFPVKLPLYLKNGLYRVLMKISAKAIASCKSKEVGKFESFLSEPQCVVQWIEILKLAVSRGVFSEKQCIQFEMIAQQLLPHVDLNVYGSNIADFQISRHIGLNMEFQDNENQQGADGAQFGEEDLMKMVAHIWDAPDDMQHDMLRVPGDDGYPLQRDGNPSHISVSSTSSDTQKRVPVTPDQSPRTSGHIDMSPHQPMYGNHLDSPRNMYSDNPRGHHVDMSQSQPPMGMGMGRMRPLAGQHQYRQYDDSVLPVSMPSMASHYVEYRGVPHPHETPLRRQSSEPTMIPMIPADRFVIPADPYSHGYHERDVHMARQYRPVMMNPTATMRPVMSSNNEIYYLLPEHTVMQSDGSLRVMMVNSGARSAPNSPRNNNGNNNVRQNVQAPAPVPSSQQYQPPAPRRTSPFVTYVPLNGMAPNGMNQSNISPRDGNQQNVSPRGHSLSPRVQQDNQSGSSPKTSPRNNNNTSYA